MDYYTWTLQYYWSLTIRLFSVISRTLVVGFLPVCRDAVSVFYSPSKLDRLLGWGRQVEQSLWTRRRSWVYIYIYIYIYMCVCGCVCVCVYLSNIFAWVGFRYIFYEISQVLIPSFPSPRLVAIPSLKRLVCPTIYLFLSRELLDTFFPKWIRAK